MKQKKVLDGENKFWSGMSSFASLVILNIITLVCCVPVVTAGAAITANAYVLDKTVMGEEPDSTVAAFIGAFKSNLKQSTIAWLIMLFFGALLCGDLYFGLAYDVSIAVFFRVFGIFGLVCWLGVASWLFPIIARYDNGLKTQLSNAVRLSITEMPRTFLMVVIQLIPGVLCVFSNIAIYILISLMSVIGFAVIGLFCALLRRKVYKKYS